MNCLEFSSAEDRLSQGDVIAWSGERDYIEKAAIVVTADCDLSKGKHWGRVTVVPLIPASAYFEQFYLLKQLEILESELLQIFGTAVQKSMKPADGEPPTMQVLEMLLGLDILPEQIAKSDDALNLHTIIRQARGLADVENLRHTLDQALTLRNPKTKSLSADKIKTFLDNPPGDCMILPAMLGLDQEIHVAFLRVLRELRDQDIALKTSQGNERKGQRIGRLVPVLRYRLTQMLAQVFSDIGLPDSYESGLKTEKNTFVYSLNQPKEIVA